ncbi:MAG: glycosyltransferase family 39 protein [Chloroflexi bacterium]|nr:glycosyltransferase family 39 protein [Chloroflexota bacterium]
MPPRTLKRLAVALAALVVAWQAQVQIGAGAMTEGALLYALALVLFLPALSHLAPARIAVGPLTADWVPAPSLARWQMGLIAAALLVSAASFALFASPARQPAAWLAHGAAVVLFAAAFARRLRLTAREPAPGEPSRRMVVAALLVILVVASLARLWQIDEWPQGTWYDEAFNGNGAARILNDPGYRPIFIESDTLPAHFAYLLTLSFRLFGVSTTSMRFVTTAFGVATAGLAFFVFRRWFGVRGGLLAAALFAVMRYDLSFSRIALHGVTTPFYELLVLYFFDRTLERRSLSDVAAAGLALGFGLAFYTPFRLFPFALAGFLLVAAAISFMRHRRTDAPGRERAALKQFAAPAVFVFVVGLVVATTPLIQFAVQYSDVFFARTATVSIFERRDEPDLLKALWSNFSKHMLMFNVQGDRNGRHNLPNEPLLDPLMGALAVLGFALALRRARDLPNLLNLSVFGVMLMGGVLTVDFEAPQALRSIGVMPAVVYFVALPLMAVGAEIQRLFASRPTAAPILALFNVAGILLLAAIGALNLSTFYDRQRNNADVWTAFSGPETVTAQEMQRLGGDYDLIVTSLWANHPTLRFVAPDVRDYAQWTVNDRLPLVHDAQRGVVLLLDPLLKATYDSARLYYPGADFREIRPPNSDNAAVYAITLSPGDLQAVQGVAVRYYRGEPAGTPAREEALSTLSFDWTRSTPLTGTFTAEFRATLHVADYDAYQFAMDGAPSAEIFVDENPAGAGAVTLAKGNHAVRVRVPPGVLRGTLHWQPSGHTAMTPVPASLLFRAPVSNSGLLGAYYANGDWNGKPEFLQVDPEISFYFHNIPLPRPYSVLWTGKLYAPVPGVYRIATDSRDNSQVTIDGQVIVDNPGAATIEGTIPLTVGWHDLAVGFADKTSHTQIYLYWTPPSGRREVVPSRYLSPPMGRYPTAAEIAALNAPSSLPVPPGGTGVPSAPVSPMLLAPVAVIGSEGTGPSQFKEPRAVAVGDDGRLYVADAGNRRVQMLDAEGKYLGAITGGETAFVEPFDVAAAPDGTIVVLDSAEGWLYRFDRDGHPLGRIGGPPQQFFHPRGLSVDEAGNLYVADTGGSRIVKLAPDGQRLQVFGTRGTGRGQFIEPSSAAADASGYLFATDVPNKRIEVFNPDGRFLLDFAIPLANPFNGPHIALAPDGTLLVTAPEPHKIQRFARDGTLLAEWGGPGSALGQLRLPTGIRVNRNIVWVADTGNNRLQKWEIR